MLRVFFGESKRKDEGLLLETVQAAMMFVERLGSPASRSGPQAGLGIELHRRATGLIDALDELEQSKYASEKLRSSVRGTTVEGMTDEERNVYRAYLYFYKNGIIRVFSLLDKLGYFMNEYFDVHTERVKPRFSYFTVLREMREKRREQELVERLDTFKRQYEVPVKRLREQRNFEIHSINYELLNDSVSSRKGIDPQRYVEDLARNEDDLRQAFEMAARSMHAVFGYCGRKRVLDEIVRRGS